MERSKAMCSSVLREAVVVAQVAITQLPHPLTQGVADQAAVDTLLHPYLLQPHQITRSTLVPQFKPLVPPPSS